MLQGVQGEPVKVTPEVDWPAVTDKSEAAWNDSLKRMQDVESGLREHVLRIPESRLDELRGEGRPTAYVLLHGVVQHSLYHAGQIVLLKKALREKESP